MTTKKYRMSFGDVKNVLKLIIWMYNSECANSHCLCTLKKCITWYVGSSHCQIKREQEIKRLVEVAMGAGRIVRNGLRRGN